MATNIGLKGLTVEYTDTGAKTAYKVDSLIVGKPAKLSIAVAGGSSDVFAYQEKLGGINGDFVDSLSSVSGVIKPIPIVHLPDEFRLNITTNTSGSIKFYITVKF